MTAGRGVIPASREAAARAVRDIGRPTFKIGPLAMAIPVSDLEAFARDAAPGDQILYASGRMPPYGTATWLLAGELGRAGSLHLKQRRTGDGNEYIAEKRPGGVAAAQPVPEAPRYDGVDEDLLALLKRCANLGQVCPTNAEIRAAFDLKDTAAASYRMRKLVQAGEIRVLDHGPTERREVTIIETGKTTIRGKV